MTLFEKSHDLDRKSILIFLAVAFIPAWILFSTPAIIRALGGENSQMTTLVPWSLAMWMPGLGAIAAVMIGEKGKLAKLNLKKLGHKKWSYLWAWIVPIFLTILTGIITLLAGWGELDTGFQIIKDTISDMPEVPGLSIPLIVGIQVAASFTIAPLFNTLFALGEELGWRGYLLPKLLPMGEVPAILISGVIWGIWHAPAILQGHNYPAHPILGTGMMVVFTVLLGGFLSWLYLRTKSPWAPALAHGTVNAVAGVPLLFLAGVDITLGGTLTSLSGWLALAILMLALIYFNEIPTKEEDVSRET
jgi:membrane protease YdiL (CAAX protease family)